MAVTGKPECPAVDRVCEYGTKLKKVEKPNGYKAVATGLGFVGSIRVGDSVKSGHDAITPEVSYCVGGAPSHGTLEPCSLKDKAAVVEAENAKVSGADTEINAATGKLAKTDESTEKEGPEVAPTGLGVGSLCPTGTFGE